MQILRCDDVLEQRNRPRITPSHCDDVVDGRARRCSCSARRILCDDTQAHQKVSSSSHPSLHLRTSKHTSDGLMPNTASVRDSQARDSGKPSRLALLVHIVTVITNTRGAPSMRRPTLSTDMPLAVAAAAQ